MTDVAWGTKRACTSCGARFYDLNKEEIVCPKCDSPWFPPKPRAQAASRPSPAAAKKKIPVVAKVEEDDIEIEDDDTDLDDEDDSLVEDTDDLADDDGDDIAKVIVSGGDDGDEKA